VVQGFRLAPSRAVIWLTALACLGPSHLNADGSAWSDSVYRRVRYLHHNRHLNHGWLDSCRIALERVKLAEPDNETCRVWLSRVLLQLGDYSESRTGKRNWYSRARREADSLRLLNEMNPEAYLWWANAQSRIGEMRGIMQSLFMLRSIRAAFMRVLEIQPNHVLGNYAMGRMYYELPGIAGGNLAEAERYFAEAARLEPTLTLARVGLAWVHVRRREWQRAREELEAVMGADSVSEPASYVEHDLPEARRLLTEIPE